MTTDDTAKRLEEIERRERAAAEGPWRADHAGSSKYMDAVSGPIWNGEEIVGRHEVALIGASSLRQQNANSAFVAHAREDIPWLLAQLKAAREQLDQAIATRQAALAGVVERDELIKAALRERDELKSKFNEIDLCRLGQAPCAWAETLLRERDEAREALRAATGGQP